MTISIEEVFTAIAFPIAILIALFVVLPIIDGVLTWRKKRKDTYARQFAFCRDCGAKMVEFRRLGGYDTYTGERSYDSMLACPDSSDRGRKLYRSGERSDPFCHKPIASLGFVRDCDHAEIDMGCVSCVATLVEQDVIDIDSAKRTLDMRDDVDLYPSHASMVSATYEAIRRGMTNP